MWKNSVVIRFRGCVSRTSHCEGYRFYSSRGFVHECLKVIRVSSRWVSQMLTEEHRVAYWQFVRQCCNVMTACMVLSFRQLSVVIINVNHLIMKRNNTQRSSSELPSMLREWWWLFWNSKGIILSHCVTKVTTMTALSYKIPCSIVKKRLHTYYSMNTMLVLIGSFFITTTSNGVLRSTLFTSLLEFFGISSALIF